MGQGYSYTCKKCNCEYSVHPGIGMRYPSVYREKLAEIEEGEYGPEWQELCKNTPFAAIDAARVVYICGVCGIWEYGTDISLYAPNAPDSIPQKQYGIKTVAEWGYVPYVMIWELTEEYHLLKRYYHRCDKCGKRMHKASTKELQNLSCPECGYKNHAQKYLCWD